MKNIVNDLTGCNIKSHVFQQRHNRSTSWSLGLLLFQIPFYKDSISMYISIFLGDCKKNRSIRKGEGPFALDTRGCVSSVVLLAERKYRVEAEVGYSVLLPWVLESSFVFSYITISLSKQKYVFMDETKCIIPPHLLKEQSELIEYVAEEIRIWTPFPHSVQYLFNFLI